MAEADYVATGLANAHEQHLTAEEVNLFGYSQTLVLCEIVLDEFGNPPVDFHYENVRQAIVNTLAFEEREAKIARQLAMLQAFIVLNQDDFAGMEVTRTDGALHME